MWTEWDQTQGVGLRAAAARLGIEIFAPPLDGQVDAAAYRRVFDVLVQAGVGALVVSAGQQNSVNSGTILGFARSARLPVMYPFRSYIAEGGLSAYGPDMAELYRRMAGDVDEILRGAKPGDIPYVLPTTLSLVINMKTADALGLIIPPNVMARADELIE